MPGFGPLPSAEFVVGINGDLANFDNADRLASIAGLAPVPHDSGRVTGNLERPAGSRSPILTSDRPYSRRE